MTEQPSRSGRGGVRPSLNAQALLESVPPLAGIANYRTCTIAEKGSVNLGFKEAIDIIEYATAAAGGGASGMVVVQGSDTLEEMAFLVSLVWGGYMPIVFTAALHHPELPTADGPRNLLSSVHVALNLKAGVYVVVNGEIHDPAKVRKCHTSDLDAFKSAEGPIGVVRGNNSTLSNILTAYPIFNKRRLLSPNRAAILTPSFDCDDWQLDAATEGRFDGFVIDGYGGGHISERWVDKLRPLAEKKPIVFASRVGFGAVLTSTYGYKGAEIDLIESGFIPAGHLSAAKARLVLALHDDLNVDWVRTYFVKNGYPQGLIDSM